MKENLAMFNELSERNLSVIESKTIKLMYDNDNWQVIYSALQMAKKADFSSTEEAMIATAASELATNILRYAGSGEIMIRVIQNQDCGGLGIELRAYDSGPGIPDIEMAMKEQYSSLSNSLGLGLPSVKRITDEFIVESAPGEGTRVLARKWKK